MTTLLHMNIFMALPLACVLPLPASASKERICLGFPLPLVAKTAFFVLRVPTF